MCFPFLIYFSIAHYLYIKILLKYKLKTPEHQKAIEKTIIISRFKYSKLIIILNVVYDNSGEEEMSEKLL